MANKENPAKDFREALAAGLVVRSQPSVSRERARLSFEERVLLSIAGSRRRLLAKIRRAVQPVMEGFLSGVYEGLYEQEARPRGSQRINQPC